MSPHLRLVRPPRPELLERLEADLEVARRALEASGDPTGVVGALLDRALGRPLRDVTSLAGKQVRARLVAHAFAIARADEDDRALPAELPLVVEALHAGSLVVDDVQDGALSRRGAPALHRVHGVPLAINTGNWLYFWPLSLLSRAGLEPDVELAMRRVYEHAVLQCHAGQALDLSVRITAVPRASVADVVAASTRWKTGALFSLATALGGLAARADEATLGALARFGEQAGVALQMADDASSILRASRCAKAEEDLLGARPTWPWAWIAESVDHASFRALQTIASAYASGEGTLDDVIAWMRPHLEHAGRVRVRRELDAAFEGLREAVGPAREDRVDELEVELRVALEVLHGE